MQNNKSLYPIIGQLLVLLYLLPLIILRENAYLPLFDNLDSEFIYRLLLKRTNTIFSFDQVTTIPQIMNGIPRSFFASGLNIYMFLIYFFDDILTAYIVNAVLVHSFAFWGMYLLLGKLNKTNSGLLRTFVSLCFSILPFQTAFGLSIAGMPLILYAFVNLFQKEKLFLSFGIIVFYSFYSLPIYTTPFVVGVIFLYLVYHWYTTHSLPKEPIIGLLLLCVMLVVIDFQMLGSVFAGKVQSHRNDFHLEKYYPSFFPDGIIFIIQNFIYQFKMPEFCLQLGIILAAVYYLIRYKKFDDKRIGVLFLINLLVIIFWSINMSKEFQVFKGHLGFLKTIHLSRFSFFLPTSFYVIFYLILCEFKDKSKSSKILVMLGCLQLAIIICSHVPVMMGIKRTLGIKANSEKDITYNEFYSPHLFSEIKDYIGKDQSSYRVASIGIFPSIALYNGFYTVDNYQNNYPLDYKFKFKKVIEEELERSESYRREFEYWGHYCLIRSSEYPIGKQNLVNKSKGWVINNLKINTVSLKELGGKYIFSTMEIKNYKELNLIFHRTFEDKDSPWKVYLYEIPDSVDFNLIHKLNYITQSSFKIFPNPS